MCTDYRVYEDVLFHIINNAIKFSDKDKKIKIVVHHDGFINLSKIKEESKKKIG